jgi:UDP-glucose 4-epimerase
MRIVVTGALGFVGSAVVRRLADRAIETVCVTRRPDSPCVQVADYGAAPEGDALIHLAEDADRWRADRGGAAYEDELRRTMATLLSKSYRRVVYASSAALYGDTVHAPRRPQEEIEVVDTYTRTKRQGELAILESGRGVGVRIANLYGPGMSPENVVSAVLRQIPGNGPVTLMDVTPVRDFLWVDDAASALVAMALGGPTGIFNLGSGTGTSIGEMARQALSLAGEAGRTVAGTTVSVRPSTRVVDISATSGAWNWRPAYSLRDGLGALIARKHQPA